MGWFGVLPAIKSPAKKNARIDCSGLRFRGARWIFDQPGGTLVAYQPGDLFRVMKELTECHVSDTRWQSLIGCLSPSPLFSRSIFWNQWFSGIASAKSLGLKDL
jgi:hypothetical protein